MTSKRRFVAPHPPSPLFLEGVKSRYRRQPNLPLQLKNNLTGSGTGLIIRTYLKLKDWDTKYKALRLFMNVNIKIGIAEKESAELLVFTYTKM